MNGKGDRNGLRYRGVRAYGEGEPCPTNHLRSVESAGSTIPKPCANVRVMRRRSLCGVPRLNRRSAQEAGGAWLTGLAENSVPEATQGLGSVSVASPNHRLAASARIAFTSASASARIEGRLPPRATARTQRLPARCAPRRQACPAARLRNDCSAIHFARTPPYDPVGWRG
jgi:hypothetical protein